MGDIRPDWVQEALDCRFSAFEALEEAGDEVVGSPQAQYFLSKAQIYATLSLAAHTRLSAECLNGIWELKVEAQ